MKDISRTIKGGKLGGKVRRKVRGDGHEGKLEQRVIRGGLMVYLDREVRRRSLKEEVRRRRFKRGG